MTFIVNHQGIVYEKDLGPDTETSRPPCRRPPNPDGAWEKVRVAAARRLAICPRKDLSRRERSSPRRLCLSVSHKRLGQSSAYRNSLLPAPRFALAVTQRC